MKFMYLDKKDRVVAWVRTPAGLLAGGLALLAVCLPLRREAVTGHFILEPARSATVRNVTPGTVTDIEVQEGSQVTRGSPLMRLCSIPLQSQVAQAEASLAVTTVYTKSAGLHYANLGSTLKEQEQFAQQVHELKSEEAALTLISPISGTVLSPRVADSLGRHVRAGTELLEIGDLSEMRASFYASEHDIGKIQLHAPVRLLISGFTRVWDAQVGAISPVPSEIDARIKGITQYKGLTTPNLYIVEVFVSNPQNDLRPGLGGVAKIYGGRRSVVEFVWSELSRFVARKVW